MLGACTRVAPPGLPAGTTLDDLPDVETWGAHLRTTANGRPAVELDAPYLARYRRAPASARLDLTVPGGAADSSAVFLGPPPATPGAPPAGRVSVRLFDASGAPSATVAADRAWLHEASGRLVAEGRVEVTGADGARVAAARVATSREGAFTASGGASATLGGASVAAPRIAATRDGAFTASGGASATIGGASVVAPRITATRGGAFTASGGTTATLTGRANATVRARTLTGTAGGTRYVAQGAARVDAASGRRLDAALVVWDDAAGRFRAPGAFSFDGPGERVRGVGLDATADLSRYSFRRATGQIEVRE